MRAAILSALLLGSEADYNETRAIQFAKFAGAAYCSSASLEAWDCGYKCDADVRSVSICHGETTTAYIGSWEGSGLVVFRGTITLESCIQDLKLWHTSTGWSECGNCKVHNGFLAEYNSLKTCVKDTLAELGFGLGSTIRTTGHSLGAAINNLALVDLSHDGWVVEESYDFGKPRTGDEAFAKFFNAEFKGRSWRVTHHKDPVPQVPIDQMIHDWHFEHVEPEIYYPSTVDQGYMVCTKDNRQSCIEQYYNIGTDLLLHGADHVNYMDVDTWPGGCKFFEESVV